MHTNHHWWPSVPSQQFQALFNPLFKVLFIFPSQYLFAIGLPPVFSLWWNLPPTLCCNPKQHDSIKQIYKWKQNPRGRRDYHPLWHPVPRDLLSGVPQDSYGTTPRKVWQHGLFPLQSPLLRESLLVSFPPLNNMLKFGGSSCLIGDPNEE